MKFNKNLTENATTINLCINWLLLCGIFLKKCYYWHFIKTECYHIKYPYYEFNKLFVSQCIKFNWIKNMSWMWNKSCQYSVFINWIKNMSWVRNISCQYSVFIMKNEIRLLELTTLITLNFASFRILKCYILRNYGVLFKKIN